MHPDYRYHLGGRSINKEWFEIPLEDVWCLFEDYLYLVTKIYDLQIFSFVLMSNHFHMLAQAPNGNLSEAMRYLMRETSREFSRLTGRINHLWGGRFNRTIITCDHHFNCAFKYVYRNPVRAKMCERVEDYKFSTLHRLFGFDRLSIPLVEDKLLFTPNFDEQALKWLNAPTNPEHDEEVRRALKRTKFEFKTSRKTGRPSELEKLIY